MSTLLDRIGQFTTIPNSIIRLWPQLGLDAMALFVYLRYRTNSQTEIAFPGYDTIAAETTLNRHRIARAARVLEHAGILERKRRFSASTLYTLRIPTPIAPDIAHLVSADSALMEASISAESALTRCAISGAIGVGILRV